jgi:hypothetical protein
MCTVNRKVFLFPGVDDLLLRLVTYVNALNTVKYFEVSVQFDDSCNLLKQKSIKY